MSKKPTAKKVNLNRRWFLIAAGIAVVFISIWFFKNTAGPLTAEKLYTQSFNPDFDYTEKSNGNKYIGQAETALKKGDYAKAIPLLDLLIAQYPDNPTYLLDKGIALIETGAFEESVRFINQTRSMNPIYTSEALWYNALACLKQNKLSQAISLLQQMPSTSNRSEASVKLIQQINTIK